jgi:hypothetical protein
MKSLHSLLVVCALVAALLFASAGTSHAPLNADLLTARHYGAPAEQYGVTPKGVVLEGDAVGMEPIASCSYDKATGALLLNGSASYKLPIPAREFGDLLRSLKKDDRVGVTLIDGRSVYWGELDGRPAGRNLSATDKLMGGLIYGFPNLTEGIKFPGGYKPRQAASRATPVIATTRFCGYRFAKTGAEYTCVADEVDVVMTPLAGDKMADGGHKRAAVRYEMEPTDRENLNYMQANKADFYAQTSMGLTKKYGEAAAVARTLRDSKIDHEALLKLLR